MERKHSKTNQVNFLEAQEVVERLEEGLKRGELPKGETLTITQSEFIRRNLATFQKWNLPRRSVYKILIDSGIELGTFDSFSRAWSYSAKKAQSVDNG